VVYLLYAWAGFTFFRGLHRKWHEEEERSGDQWLAVEAAEAELLELEDRELEVLQGTILGKRQREKHKEEDTKTRRSILSCW